MDGLNGEMLSKLKIDNLTVEKGLLSLFDGLGSLVNVMLRMLKEYGGGIEAFQLFYNQSLETIIPREKLLRFKGEKSAQDNELNEQIDEEANDIQDNETSENIDQEDDFNLGKATINQGSAYTMNIFVSRGETTLENADGGCQALLFISLCIKKIFLYVKYCSVWL